MEKIEGIIQVINAKDDRYGIKLSDGNWYNDFGKPLYEDNSEMQKGDKVNVVYDVKGIFRNIKNIEKTGESATKQADEKTSKEFFPPASEYDKDRDKIIIRQTATKCASWIVAGLFKTGQAYTFEATVDLIKKYADAIEKRIILGIEEDK